MLISTIKDIDLIKPYICKVCSENGFAAVVDPVLTDGEDYLIIKVDDFYNKENIIFPTPPSPDCFIIVKCSVENHYKLYIVELKDIKDQNKFEIKNIREKFHTCINHFMSDVLREYLSNEDVVFTKIELLFVTDPYNERDNGSRHLKSKSTKMDSLLALNTRPYMYDGKRLGITHQYTSPMIKPC